MTLAQCLTVVGLILGMIGVAVIFVFGPPQPNFETGVPLELEDDTPLPDGETAGQHGLEVEKLKRRYLWWSRFGLGCVFLGFAFQLCAVFVNGN